MPIAQNHAAPRHLLLLGAGFSHNYGGWLADELTADLMGRVSEDQELLNQLRTNSSGFEGAFEQVRIQYEQEPTDNAKENRFFKLQNAVIAAFAEMNGTYERTKLEFQDNDPVRWVATFLARFDIIFTLNQDLLLERRYRPQSLPNLSAKTWMDFVLPGMTYVARSGTEDEMWVPDASPDAFASKPGHQPVVKLHGSVKWLDIDDPSGTAKPMLIIGTNKPSEISQSPILRRYHEMFRAELSQPNTRLMVIGYGFGDRHINDLIASASSQFNLQTFIVDPLGLEVLEKSNPSWCHAMKMEDPIEKITIIGLSRRPLCEIFGRDQLAWNQLNRFFAL